jgi:hypothetical protein
VSIHLRPDDQRWLLICDRTDCPAHIVADPADHATQRQQLAALANDLRWRRMPDAADLCSAHAVDAPEPIERGCTKRTWCVEREGHAGACVEAAKRALPPTDFGPMAAARRRY